MVEEKETRQEKYKDVEENIRKEEKKDEIKKIVKKGFKIFFIVFGIFVGFLLYMHYVGTSGLVVREYKVSSKKLPSEMHGLKVVHFSDLNYLSTTNKKSLKKTVNRINELKPDIVVFTGNLVASGIKLEEKDKKDIIKYLNMIDSKIGVYAIKGSKDYNKQYDSIMAETNIKILNNSYEVIYYKGNTPILLNGCGSSNKKDCDLGQTFSYSEMDNLYTITLVHEPDVTKDIIKNYKTDLILAGHSLNGQIRLPGIGGLIKPKGAKKYVNPKYEFKNTTLYVSGGLGTNGSKLRYFNHPSINFYRLVKETN